MSDRPEAPLKAQLQRDAERAKRDLRQPGFSRQDYDRLLTLAGQTRKRLESCAMEAGERGRLAHCQRVLQDLLTLEEDSEAEVVRPTDSQVYLTGLEVGQLAHIVGQLAQSNGRWNPRVQEVVTGRDLAPAALADRRFRLQFLAMCRQAGLRPDPRAGGLDALMEVSGWRVGVAAEVVSDVPQIATVVRRASERLRAARVAGLIVLETTSIAWPERAILRVASDSTAVGEINRRVDDFLTTHRGAIGSSVDPNFVFGAVAVATIPTYNVSTRHVAFTMSFRIAALCPEKDPRYDRLVAFARQFEGLGGERG
ncbi:MAG: hypothetical protein H6811_01255 [Phycisphaeraceae bacterium]|nr:hypothetical protein [Phycisphaeraceae bacterium]